MDDLFPHSPFLEARQLHALVLAYIGDAVYDLYVRQYVVSKGHYKPNELHRQATRYVSAKAQARILHEMIPILTEEEHEVVKRGRNAKSGTVPKNTDVVVYRHSTGFEALVGYLYYEKRYERLQELLQFAIGEPND